MPFLLSGLCELALRYDVVLSDVWGVAHNGAAYFPGAADALARFRRKGGAVVLITNSPAPSRIVTAQLDQLGFPREAYDGVVSSGDVTVSLVRERRGQSLYFIGAPQDVGVFEEIAALDGTPPQKAPIEAADYVLCTGFIDFWREAPPDYDERLKRIFERRLDFICANPDIVVENAGVLAYCAGAIAERYERLGGNVIQAGKPYPEIYERALARAAQSRGQAAAELDRSRVLAIGDAMRTDIAGACAQSVDSILITSGIHRDELHRGSQIDDAALRQFVAAADARPTAVMPELVW